MLAPFTNVYAVSMFLVSDKVIIPGHGLDVQSLSVTLANRLYLNLKAWADPRPGFSRHTCDLASMNFDNRRVSETIGASIDMDDELYDDAYINGDYPLDEIHQVDGST